MMERALTEEIVGFVRDSRDNRFPDSMRPYFDNPVVGYAAADDPLFIEYKRIIGPFHLAPEELLSGAKTVICWVLPVTRETRESNRREARYPSSAWAQTRQFGERLNCSLRRHLVDCLVGLGYRGVAPQLSPLWKEHADTPVGIASTWSERHAAYAAGLGTFSLNDALITSKGIAHRLGSVITDLVLPASPRTAPDRRHNCLWHREGTCGLCIDRCPVGALSRQGHDKAVCRDYVYGAVPEAVAEGYGVTQTGCGLCQTKVPCETSVPQGRGRGDEGAVHVQSGRPHRADPV